MSRILSANVTNGKNGSSDIVWLVKVTLDDGTEYRWSTLHTNDFAEAWTGDYFDGSVLAKGKLGKIRVAIDITEGGNVDDLNDWTFEINNSEMTFWDTIDDVDFTNRSVELRLIFADQTNPSWDNACKIYKGFIKDVGPIGKTIPFSCVGSWLAIHEDLPKKTMTKERFAFLPPELEGRRFGMVYGNFLSGFGYDAPGVHKTGIGYGEFAPTTYAQGKHKDYIPAAFVKLETDGGAGMREAWLAISEHELFNKKNFDNFDYCFAIWVDEVKGYCLKRFPTNVDTPYNGTQFGIWASGSPTDYEKLAGFDAQVMYQGGATANKYICVIPFHDPSVGSGWTNPENVEDEDPDNYCSFSTGTHNIRFRFPIHKPGSTFERIFLNVTKTGTVQINWTVSDTVTTDSGSMLNTDPAWSSTYTFLSYLGNLAALGAVAFENPLYVNLQFVVAVDSTAQLYNVYVRTLLAQKAPSDEDVIAYESVSGRMYGGYVDAVGRSNAYDAGDLIENPAGVVESLFCDCLRLTPASVRGSMDFNGSTHEGIISHSESLVMPAAGFTIAFWLRFDNYAVQGIMGKLTSLAAGAAAPFRIYLLSNRRVRFYVGNGITEAYLEGATYLNINAWYRVVCVYYAANSKIYINNSEDASGSMMVSPVDFDQCIKIGKDDKMNYRLNGKLEEIVFATSPWGTQDVADDYNSGAGKFWTPTDGISLILHGNDGAGRRAFDDSGLNNHMGSDSASAPWLWHSSVYKVLSPEKIDGDSFDTLYGDRSSWKFARYVGGKEVVNSRELIRGVCREGCFAQVHQYDGLQSLKKIDLVGSASVIYGSDMLNIPGNPACKLIPGDLAKVKNEFILHYKKNYATGEFEKTMYVRNPKAGVFDSEFTNLPSDGETYWDKCHASAEKFAFVILWEYEAEWIRDKDTAELFLKWMIDRLTWRPYFIEFKTHNLNLIDIELLDARRISHYVLHTGLSTKTFQLVDWELDPDKAIIGMLWQQVTK